jgi:xylose isomerase
MFWLLSELKWKGVVEYDCHMLRCEADTKDQIGCRKRFIENASTGLSIALELADRVKGNWAKGLAETEADLHGIVRMCGLSQRAVNSMTKKQ